MEGIFSLPYSEYEVINHIQKKFKKTEHYACYIPTSRQQKGLDFIIHNNSSNKLLRVQVKSSRSYSNKPEKNKKGIFKEVKYKYGLWFNNFIDKFEIDLADYYMLIGLYPVYQQNKNIRSKTEFWKNIVLCFNSGEMFDLLKEVKTKKDKKTDKFFGFGFTESDKIFATRGFDYDKDFSEYLLKNKLDELKAKLK